MSQGLARSARLFRLFLREQTAPGLFYGALAEDAVSQFAEKEASGIAAVAGAEIASVVVRGRHPDMDVDAGIGCRLDGCGYVAIGR